MQRDRRPIRLNPSSTASDTMTDRHLHSDDEDTLVDHDSSTIRTTAGPPGSPSRRARSRNSVVQAPLPSPSTACTRTSIARVKDEFDVLDKMSGTPFVTVKQVWHRATSKVLVIKSIVIHDRGSRWPRSLIREFDVLHHCNSRYIIPFLGAFYQDSEVHLCMEFMDVGSLEQIYLTHGAIEINIVGSVAMSVLEALSYMYRTHGIVHKDVRPSNIFCNSLGEIKVHAFALSQEHIQTIMDNTVPTSTYNSPEQIQGAHPTIKSDVWSVGISLVELAIGRFPYSEPIQSEDLVHQQPSPDSSHEEILDYYLISPSDIEPDDLSAPGEFPEDPSGQPLRPVTPRGVMKMSILELVQHIVNEPPPKLQSDGEITFPDEAKEFVDWCLMKDPDLRKSPDELLMHDWIRNIKKINVDVQAWVQSLR
ncbi:hypothetical protein AX16_004563 [Volvariella volvacea WC 439]|nr:hypothetical protein AX16_004563 [Volvariella volvacea WC 439]